MMNLYRKISLRAKTILDSKRFRALSFYLLVYILLLLPMVRGIGQFWDWTFPYFTEHIPNIFFNRSLSWTDLGLGKPLDYSTDYFLRFFMSLFSFVSPERLRFSLMVIIFALSSYGVFLIANKKLNPLWSFVLGLLAVINPAIFYKFLAGHFNYFVSYLIFIYLAYYLLFKFEKNLKSAVVAGLLLSFIGIQIQFFFLGFLTLFIYFFFERKKFDLKYFALVCLMVFLVNSIWLSNFMFKGADIASFSTDAAKISVAGSKGTELFNILDFSFSKATLIEKLYGNQYLVFFILFYAFLFLFLLKSKTKDKIEILFFTLLMILTMLGTGIYNSFQIWPISVIYPMFREVGHFAPLIVLLLVLSVSRVIADNRIPNFLFFCFAASFLIINFYKFYQYPPALDFSGIRGLFEEFDKNNNNDSSTYRILFYPFFDQYSIKSNTAEKIDNVLINNSGHDSFMTFSGKEFINNAVPPHQFKDSLQYKLLKTGDVDILKPYNIKYIYNFSNIYESNYDSYVPSYVYDNDLSLIKNEDGLFDRLIAQNPGKLVRVSDNILEVKDFELRIYSADHIFRFESLDNLDLETNFTKNVLKKNYDYAIASSAKNAPSVPVDGLFGSINDDTIDYSRKMIFDIKTSSEAGKASLYSNDSKSYVYAKKKNDSLIFYKRISNSLRLNGKGIGEGGEEIVKEISIDPGKKYYIGWGAQLAEDKDGANLNLGILDKDTIFELYSSGNENLIPNASFQEGLWNKEVADCNKYDGNPILDMKLGEREKVKDIEGVTNGADSSSGNDNKFLQLEAMKHTACTTNKFDVSEDTDYLFSFDYQSPNAKTAGYYLEFDGPDRTMIKEQVFINDAGWHNYAKKVKSPAGSTMARLYLYAYSTDEKTDIINRYDNFSLVKLDKENEVDVDYKPEFKKQEVDLEGTDVFEYADPYYSYVNVIPNASFEDGLWEGKARDCNNYDNNPDIGVALAPDDSSNGTQSMELESTRHSACTSAVFPVKENADYLFSFDYQSPNAKTAGYYLEFNDKARTVSRELLDIKDANWQNFIQKIKAPAGATSARLYVYSYETDRKTNMITRYDNFKFIELPGLDDKYYLVGSQEAELKKPGQVEFETINSTKKLVKVKSATTSFFLAMSESYHPEWRLVMDNKKTQGILANWTPLANPDKIPDENHFKMDNFMNGWYVDINDLCRNKDLCHENPDGGYDLDMMIEFAPQRWFNISFLASGLTLILSLGYLAWDRVRNRSF